MNHLSTRKNGKFPLPSQWRFVIVWIQWFLLLNTRVDAATAIFQSPRMPTVSVSAKRSKSWSVSFCLPSVSSLSSLMWLSLLLFAHAARRHYPPSRDSRLVPFPLQLQRILLQLSLLTHLLLSLNMLLLPSRYRMPLQLSPCILRSHRHRSTIPTLPTPTDNTEISPFQISKDMTIRPLPYYLGKDMGIEVFVSQDRFI